MELKTKYQYTYFIQPYVVNETKYSKYILKLFKDKNCSFKVFEKEKDLDIYNYFLPHVRDYLFPTFECRGAKLREFNSLSEEAKARIVSKHSVACFEYNLTKDIQGKVGEENGIFFSIAKIQIICFNSGICFLAIKTNIEETQNFSDLLDFNYRFRTINSEFYSLKNYENIRIQTDTFTDIKDITELITQITGTYQGKIAEKEFDVSSFYLYSYACLESDRWNDKNDFIYIENDFYKYANALPRSYISNFNETNMEQNLHIIDKFKYSKISLTKTCANILCSGIDTFNYTVLPFQYENEYFYTYILSLYKKMFLKKLNSDFKEHENVNKLRNRFFKFTKQICEKEITQDDTGSLFYRKLENALELNDIYNEIEMKYEIAYRDLNIDKNNSYYAIMIILLIFSLLFNMANILILLYMM